MRRKTYRRLDKRRGNQRHRWTMELMKRGVPIE
jgi:hypothetical protein